MDNVLLCSNSSQRAEEQLFATVKQTSLWFLLEYKLPIGTDAFVDSHIPLEVKNHLETSLEDIPNSRMLLVKRGAHIPSQDLKLYVVNALQTDPWIHEIIFSDYHELLRIDLLKYVKGIMTNPSFTNHGSLFLVCTNGKRDPCCAKLGLPLYQNLSKTPDLNIWRCSHVGGHRFAPNLICFPHGIFYGRLDPELAHGVIKDYKHGKLAIENYRGRPCYTKPAQAGEYFLRTRTENFDINAYNLIQTIETSTDQWEVLFLSKPDGKVHTLHISAEISRLNVYTGCNKPQGVNPIQYHLTNYQTL